MRKAFSLVELSIVLVILGLLVGGILAGQSLIKAAELRSISTEYNRYITAGQAFRDRYLALPGDMSNATSVWGAAHATPATCITTVGTGTATCNGNADNQILYSSGSNEMFRVWQHLANAGLIEGNYTGVAGGGSAYDATIGTNAPASKRATGGWTTFYHGVQLSNGSWFDGDYGNMLIVGTDDATTYTLRPLFTTEDAWNVDTKIDDGMPGTGRIVPYPRAGCSNAASSADTTGTYTLTSTTVACSLAFRKAFY